MLDIARVPLARMKADRDSDPWEKFMRRTGQPLSGIALTATWPGGRQTQEPIRLRITFPFYGGERYWFECPVCRCRVAKLYTQCELRKYACRRCLGLVYHCQYRKGWYWALVRGGREHLAGPREPYHYTRDSEMDIEKILKAGPPRA